MKLRDGMLLFHGSYTAVEHIDLNQCAAGKDFGKGFYLTSDMNQAKSFIRSVLERARARGVIPIEQQFGFVSSYRFRMPPEDLTVHESQTADKESVDVMSTCADMILANAIEDMADDEGISISEARQRLITSEAYQ